MGYFLFTKRLVCPACRCVFTITSAASKFCQNRDCKAKRRRERYAETKEHRALLKAYKASRAAPAGSDAHLERALESGE